MLNLGCGDWKIPAPWVNVDSYAGMAPDVVADVRVLPFGDGSVSRVYCGHVLEHLSLLDVPAALREVRRVLCPGGRLCVVGPDENRALANDEWVPLLPAIRCGGDRWPGDHHCWVPTGRATAALVGRVFADAVEVPVADTAGWPVWDRVGWQFAVVASKEAGCG